LVFISLSLLAKLQCAITLSSEAPQRTSGTNKANKTVRRSKGTSGDV